MGAISFSAISFGQVIDTLTSHFVGAPALYYADAAPYDSGYVSGTNAFGDLAKLQKFDATFGVTGGGTITGVCLMMPRKIDGGGSFTVEILEDNAGTPTGAPLATVTATIASVDTAVPGSYAIVDGTKAYNVALNFATPAVIPANHAFWVKLTLPVNTPANVLTNLVAVATNNAQTNPFASPTYSGELWDDGTFHTISSSWTVALAFTMYPICSFTAGIDNNVASASVYPNPANSVLNINSTEDVASVRVLTTDGKVVATSVSSTSINVADLNAGMYLYEVTTVSGKVARGNFAKN